jgi:hypothetical protein
VADIYNQFLEKTNQMEDFDDDPKNERNQRAGPKERAKSALKI